MKKVYHTSTAIEELLELIPDQFDKSPDSNVYALLNSFGIALDDVKRNLNESLGDAALETIDISRPSMAYKTELTIPVSVAQGDGIELSLAENIEEFLLLLPHTRSSPLDSIALPVSAFDIAYYSYNYNARENNDCLLVSTDDRVLIVDPSTGDVIDELHNTMSITEEEVNANGILRYIPQDIRVQDAFGNEPIYSIEGKQLQVDTPGEYYVAYTYQDKAGIRGVTVDDDNIIHDSSYQHVVVTQVLSEEEVQGLLGGDSPPVANGKWIIIVIEPAQPLNRYNVAFDGAAGTYAFNGFPATYDETNNRYYIILTYPVDEGIIDEWLDFSAVNVQAFTIRVDGDIRYDYLCYDKQRECFWGIYEDVLYRLSLDYDMLEKYDIEIPTIRGLAYKHGHLYILDGVNYLYVYDAYSVERIHSYQLQGNHAGLAFDAEGYMWTISDNGLIKHRLYYDYYVNDEYDCFTKEKYDSFVINGVEVPQEPYPLWTPLDTIGLLFDVERLPNESNADYRDRLRHVYVYPSNNTEQGLINSISRAVGYDTNIVYVNNTVKLRDKPLSYAEVSTRQMEPYDVGEHDDYNLLISIDGIPIKRTTVVIRKENGRAGRVYRSVGQIFSVDDDTVLIGFHLGIITDALARVSLLDAEGEMFIAHWYANGFYEMIHPDRPITLDANKEYIAS